MLPFRRAHPNQEDLSAYLDGELQPHRMEAVARHVAACESCAALVEELGSAKASLSQLTPEQPSRSFRLGPEFALPASQRQPAGVRRPSPFAFAPAVALTLLVTVLAVDFVIVPAEPTAREDRLATTFKTEDNAAAGRSLAPSSQEAASGAQGLMPEAPREVAAAQPAPTGRDEAADSTSAIGEPVIPNSAEDESNERTWLRVLEGVLAVIFIGSLVVVLWPRLQGRGES